METGGGGVVIAIPGLVGERPNEVVSFLSFWEFQYVWIPGTLVHILRSWTHGPHRVCVFEILGSFESKQ